MFKKKEPWREGEFFLGALFFLLEEDEIDEEVDSVALALLTGASSITSFIYTNNIIIVRIITLVVSNLVVVWINNRMISFFRFNFLKRDKIRNDLSSLPLL